MRLKDADKDFVKKLKGTRIGVTFGGDPEFFIADENGNVMASDKFFPGKEKPINLKGIECYDGKEEGCDSLKLFFDGIQAEMNIGIQRCREYIADNVRRCFAKAAKIIETKNKNYKILIKPSVEVSKEVIINADPEARRFGCLPDFNAYTCTTNTNEIDATNHPYRYAGGHIHLGVSSPYLAKSSGEWVMAKTEEGHLRIIKLLDLIVGIPCVLLDNSKEAMVRRSEYGKAGCFRPTPYGIEYRTPSCWWIKSPITVSLILGLARLAWTIAGNNADEELFKLIGYDQEYIRGVCDESDRKEALKIWTSLRPYLALIGTTASNPLHIRSMASDESYLKSWYNPMSGRMPPLIDNKTNTAFKKAEFSSSKSVFSLATFEYLIKNGLSKVILDDVKKEWSIGRGRVFNNCYGFLRGMYLRLYKDKDFLNFQTSILEDII